jgi:hypothetical protein
MPINAIQAQAESLALSVGPPYPRLTGRRQKREQAALYLKSEDTSLG